MWQVRPMGGSRNDENAVVCFIMHTLYNVSQKQQTTGSSLLAVAGSLLLEAEHTHTHD